MTSSSAWSSRRLGDLAATRSGGTPHSQVDRYYGGGIPWVSIADMTDTRREVRDTARTLTEDGLAASAAVLYEPGVVLYAMYASLGECAIAPGPVSSSQAILGIDPGPDLDRDFLYYHLEFIKPLVKRMGQQGTQSNLNAGMVRDFLIPLPPITEQRAIAAVLADADHWLDVLERTIAKKEAIAVGMRQQLLTGETRLPGFSSEWLEVILGEHVTYVKTVSLSRAELDADSPVRYLHYGDIHTRSDVKLDAARETMPRVRAELLGSAGMLQVGDLVFADASEDSDGVGKSVELTSVPAEGLVAGLHTIAARFDKGVLDDGFKSYLQFIPQFRRALLRLAAGTKVIATTRSYISSIELALPGVEEQRAIAGVLADADAEIELLRARLAKARAVKEGMMQELLTGRTRLPDVEAAA